MLRIIFEVDGEPSPDIIENENHFNVSPGSSWKLFTILITVKHEYCDMSEQNERINKYLAMYNKTN